MSMNNPSRYPQQQRAFVNYFPWAKNGRIGQAATQPPGITGRANGGAGGDTASAVALLAVRRGGKQGGKDGDRLASPFSGPGREGVLSPPTMTTWVPRECTSVCIYIYIYIYFAFRISMLGIQVTGYGRKLASQLKEVKQRFGDMLLSNRKQQQEVSPL